MNSALAMLEGVKVDRERFESIVEKLLATPPPEPKAKKARRKKVASGTRRKAQA